jgi:hypothetical protein
MIHPLEAIPETVKTSWKVVEIPTKPVQLTIKSHKHLARECQI